MRIAGGVLLVLAASGFGVMLSYTLTLRVKKLELALRYIERITEEMRFSGDELQFILQRVKSDVFIKDGEWHGIEGLKSTEYEVLKSFLASLGTTDLQGQQKNAAAHISSLENILKEARKEKAEYSRLYISLGVLGGLFVAILLV